MLRLVLDTDVVVAAVRSDRGASRRLLTGVLEGVFQALASVPLMLQYEAVLNRPEHLTAAALSTEDIQIILDAFAAVAEAIRIAYLWRPLLPDPGDDLVLETAVNGSAAAIVTFNRRHFTEASRAFGLQILTPGDVIRRMETRT
jgi:putative PIN family toxin of toxin-antitoxin system